MSELQTVIVDGPGWGRTLKGFMSGGAIGVRVTTLTERVSRELNDWLPKKDVVVFPNPTEAGSNIQVALRLKEKGQYRLELMDGSGRIVWMQNTNVPELNYKLSIPTQSAWSAGMYWLRISGKHTNKVYNCKIILQ